MNVFSSWNQNGRPLGSRALVYRAAPGFARVWNPVHQCMPNPNNLFRHIDHSLPRQSNRDAQDISLSLHSFYPHGISRVCFLSSPPALDLSLHWPMSELSKDSPDSTEHVIIHSQPWRWHCNTLITIVQFIVYEWIIKALKDNSSKVTPKVCQYCTYI